MADSVKQLAETYLKLSEKENGEETESGLESLKEEVEEWKEKMEERDEEDPLYEIAESKYQEAKDELDQIRESKNQLEKAREELLEELSSKFVPQDEWLDAEVIKAVNKVLTGEQSSILHVNDEEIDSNYSGDPEDLFDLSERVRRLAEDKLKRNEEVKEFWDKFQSQKKFEPFKVVAKAGKKLSREEIANRMDRDVDKGKVGGNIRNTIHQTDFNPYHREGGYSLSLTGKYFKENYMGTEEFEEETEADSSQDKEKEKNKSKQQKFFDTVAE